MNATERPKQYVKGPDMGSKSERTRRRYRSLLAGQSCLTNFGFTATRCTQPPHEPSPSTPLLQRSNPVHEIVEIDSEPLPPCHEDDNEIVVVEIRNHDSEDSEESESRVAADATCDAAISVETQIAEGTENAAAEGDCDAEAAWEEELDDRIGAGAQIRSWEDLRKQVKLDLKKNSKTLPLSRVNQLLIIRNFATLRIKGYGRMAASHEIARQFHEGEGVHFARRVRALARHYQIFEQLPIEKRGGRRASRSVLMDEPVRTASREWLTTLPSGTVNPRSFQAALNSTILPALGIITKRPLCERTARRYLVTLGWRLTTLRKGVYMDGHERPDVVKYRQEEFLPQMAKFEAQMAHYEGPELRRVPPTLAPGEKEIIAMFHDECCFHANDYKGRAWSVSYIVLFSAVLNSLSGYERARLCCRRRVEVDSSTSPTSLMKPPGALSNAMTMEILYEMHARLFILVQMVTLGGITRNSWYKSRRPSASLRLHIQTVFVFSSSISRLLTHHFHPMHLKPSR